MQKLEGCVDALCELQAGRQVSADGDVEPVLGAVGYLHPITVSPVADGVKQNTPPAGETGGCWEPAPLGSRGESSAGLGS